MERPQIISLLQYGHTAVSKLLLDYYAKIGLNEPQMMILLHIHRFIEDNHPFPTPAELSERMSMSESECTELLRSLIKNDYLEMQKNQDDDQVMYETYSLTPLFRRIVQEQFSEAGGETEKDSSNQEGELYEIFEQEFSRPLSPMECETINVWMDQDKYRPELIKTALHEAVLAGKLNLRYIDRILHEWHKNGIRTHQEAKAYGEKFRKHQTSKTTMKDKTKPPQYPNINWLDES
ncbi:DNA replication protein [Salibacterium salarium]|uniref:DnaD domain-containing protein n=1 Tax=Salibacterium salarium TaxID=284579 RepID=UPI002788E72C|nr:DnaD domain-containing protein [Salibacterium salarium]MDQ0299403.1 DNA replication protein [Salibacterium salarium]